MVTEYLRSCEPNLYEMVILDPLVSSIIVGMYEPITMQCDNVIAGLSPGFNRSVFLRLPRPIVCKSMDCPGNRGKMILLCP